MDKSMIREALEAADRIPELNPSNYNHDDVMDLNDHAIDASVKAQSALAELDKPGEGDPDAHLSDEDYLKAKQERFAKGGLANVDPDKYMEEVRGTGMVLDDIELERCYQRRKMAHAHSGLSPEEAHKAASEYKAGMMQARLRYLAPAKAPAELLRAGWMVDGAVNNEGFARLTFTKPENEPTAVEVEVYAALKSNTPEHGN